METVSIRDRSCVLLGSLSRTCRREMLSLKRLRLFSDALVKRHRLTLFVFISSYKSLLAYFRGSQSDGLGERFKHCRNPRLSS
ncbi:hypothetical protein RB5102 [Rhodopirellula baltica SH 1]|uniref:Uncharacterized protein n=1 Tax=Rhodopirellula baltica (strain DSM 10527 / NCIMB 13988 / SH1) TaxID=243090 RepID=Q7UGP0_RHOBA|nr:hypothetical protein RB5102 [Rhodopirellula baltica SH 1]